MDKLKISLGKTYNLGNYESLRVDVGIEKFVEFADEKAKHELYEEVLDLMVSTAKKIKVA